MLNGREYYVHQVTLTLAGASLVVFYCSCQVVELSYHFVRHQTGFADD
jgi:hypothetical protein